MLRTISTMLLLATLLGACAGDPMQSYYACRRSGVGVSTCPGRMAVDRQISSRREPG